jgi:hypothetical protein
VPLKPAAVRRGTQHNEVSRYAHAKQRSQSHRARQVHDLQSDQG